MTRKGMNASFGHLCVLASFALPVHAGSWTTEASVTPGLTFSDNVCLDRDNNQSDWIAFVTPGLVLTGEGNRANVALAAAVEMNSLTDGQLEDLGCSARGFDNRNQFAPRLNATADAVLVEDWLYLDADALARQTDANPYQSGAVDSFDRTGNTNDTYSYGVSPYLFRRFKDVAEVLLRYRWDQQYNSKSSVGDSTREYWQLKVDSGPVIYPFSVGVQADYDSVEYDSQGQRGSRDNELKSVRVNLGYRINRSWELTGYYGEEDNDFFSTFDDIDGDFWSVGARWTPNARVTAEAGYGDRFFGNTPYFDISYRHKRSVLSASYRKQVTYDRSIRTLGNPFPVEDEFGNPIDPGTGLPADDLQEPTTVSTSPILDERYTLGYAFQGRRNTFRINASQSEQTRAEDGRDSTFSRASALLSHNLAKNFSLYSRISWFEEEPRGPRSDLVFASETVQLILGGDRQFTSDLSVRLEYQYTDRDSDRPEQVYEENQVTLSARFTW